MVFCLFAFRSFPIARVSKHDSTLGVWWLCSSLMCEFVYMCVCVTLQKWHFLNWVAALGLHNLHDRMSKTWLDLGTSVCFLSDFSFKPQRFLVLLCTKLVWILLFIFIGNFDINISSSVWMYALNWWSRNCEWLF